MKKTFMILAVMAVLLSSVFSQSKPSEPQKGYEYLVYSFGKTYFDDVSPDDRYYHFLYSADKGKNLNEKLNQLGRLGWELIDVLGTIGGDQQVVFMRPIGLLTEEAETELVTQIASEEQDKLIKSLTKENPDPAIPLVETDQRDWDIEYSKNNDLFMAEVTRIAEYIRTCKGVTEAVSNENVYSPAIAIKWDLSEQLLKGNEYSLSKTKEYAAVFFKEVKKQVQFDKFVYYGHTVTLNLTVTYTYEGNTYEVYSEEYKIERNYR